MMRLPTKGLKSHLTDSNNGIPSATAGGSGGFSVWSPRPPARLSISLSVNGYYKQAYSLTDRPGCPIDWVHRRFLNARIVIITKKRCADPVQPINQIKLGTGLKEVF